jgi:dGTPase
LHAWLAGYAAHDHNSLGRQYEEETPAYRGEFQRDRDRIIHATAFRRLEYKTQVFVNHEGDLFRTRLTHSIEVAQIARTIARALHLNEDLSEAIALAHDLGHTPFGHAGQDELNHCMKNFGGFEHNLQSLRVVDLLEEKYASFPGINLTFEAREGILKHCSRNNALALGELGKRFIEKTHPSLEAQLTNIADEIAYNNHDVDDGLRSGLISIEQLRKIELFEEQFKQVRERYPSLNDKRTINETVRRIINVQVVDLIKTSTTNIEAAAPRDIFDVRRHSTNLVSFSDEMREKNLSLKQFLRRNLYEHYRVLRMTSKSTRVIRELFTAFFETPSLLPDNYYLLAMQAKNENGESGFARIIADYIAGMTDRYAISEYDKMFSPKTLT